MCPSGGGQLAESQCELWRSGSEEAAGQSPAAAAGAEQAGSGVPELSRRPEGTLLRCLQTVRHHSKYNNVDASRRTLKHSTKLSLLLKDRWNDMMVVQALALCVFHPVFLWQGENVARELQALVKDLPAVLDEVGKDAAKLEEQIQLYTAFTNFVCEWWVCHQNTVYFSLCCLLLCTCIFLTVCYWLTQCSSAQ